MFVPADEAFLRGLFEDGVVTGCRWRGTRIGPREAVSSLACDGGAAAGIRLAPLEDAGPEDAKTPLFAVGLELTGSLPSGLRKAVLARVKERSAAFRWKTTEASPVTDDDGPQEAAGSGGASENAAPAAKAKSAPPATAAPAARSSSSAKGRFRVGDYRQAAAFSAGLLLIGSGVVLLRRCKVGTREETHAGERWYLPARVAPPLIAIAALLTVAPPFTFRLDDFDYLVKALSPGSMPDQGGRFLGVTIPFALGARIGLPFFLGASVLAAAGYGWLLAALARRFGASAGGARLGASLAVTTLPALLLFSWAAQFQQLAAMAGLAGAVLALVRAYEAPEPEGRQERLAATLLAAGAAVLCVLSKFAVASLVVPTGAVAALALGRVRRALLPLGAAALAQLSALAAFEPLVPSGEIDRFGLSRVVSNLSLAGPWAGRALLPLAALAFLVIVLFRRGRAPEGPGLPVWRSLLLALTLAALWLAPFLLNARYFTSYYLALALGPLCIVLGETVARRTASIRQPVLGVAVALALVPFASIASFRKEIASEFVDLRPLLARVAEAARGRSAPAPIALVASCDDAAAAARAAVFLEQCWKSSERGSAFQWATGWHRTPFRVSTAASPPRPGELVVTWCGEGRAP